MPLETLSPECKVCGGRVSEPAGSPEYCRCGRLVWHPDPQNKGAMNR